jgi:hypothetical protein
MKRDIGRRRKKKRAEKGNLSLYISEHIIKEK